MRTRLLFISVLLLAQAAAFETIPKQSTENIQLPVCSKTTRGQKKIGWGKYGLRFVVNKNEVNVLGGKPDVDYVKYIVRPKKRESFLQLWFGGFTLALDPDREKVDNSVSVTQSKIVNAAGGAVVGKGSRGFMSGGQWRHFAVGGQGSAVYDKATPEDVALFRSNNQFGV